METNTDIKNIAMADLIKKQNLIISGPCSAENEEQVLRTALELKATGRVDILRAGVWKPRTNPGGFEGAGGKALSWLLQAKKITELLKRRSGRGHPGSDDTKFEEAEEAKRLLALTKKKPVRLEGPVLDKIRNSYRETCDETVRICGGIDGINELFRLCLIQVRTNHHCQLYQL